MEAALPSEKFIPDYTASHPIFKIWIIAAYFHTRSFLPELTETEIRQQAWSVCEHRFEPGTFQMRRIINYTSRGTEQRRRKWRKESGRRRGMKDRTAYIVSDDTDGRHSECWCIYCDYYYTAQTGSVRHAITILQFPNEQSTEQDKICETCARSFTQRRFLHAKRSSPRLVCGTVIMFNASISSSDTTPSTDKARRQFVMGGTGSTLRSCAWTPPEEVKCLAIPGYLSFGFPWLYISS